MTVLQIGQMPLYSIKHFWINRRTAGKVNPAVFFIAHPFQQQEGIGQGNQGDMMIPSLPRAAFKMIQPHFPFHLLVILFNTETSLRLSDQPSERSPMRRQTRKPVLPGVFIPLRPFDQQLLRWFLHRLSLNQSVGHPNHYSSKAGRKRPFSPFSPGDLLPTLRGQVFGNLTETSSRGQFFCIKAFSSDSPTSFHRRLGGMRIFRPGRQIPTDFNHVIQRPSSQRLPEYICITISRIGQYQTILHSPSSDFLDQIQSQLSLRLKGDFLWDPSLLPSYRIIDPLFRKIQAPIQGCTRFLCSQIQRYRHLTVRSLSQCTAVLSHHSYLGLALLGKRDLVNEPVSFGNKFSLHLSGQRRLHLRSRPGALIHKLLQRLNVSIRKTIGHWLDGFPLPIHEETSYVFLGMLSPLFATPGQDYT